MYANTSKICFNIKGKRETFFFKNGVQLFPAHPQHPYEPKNKNNPKNKNRNRNKKQQQMELVGMINAVHREHDHQLKSPYLIKKDDPDVPTIECTLNRSYF
jgi:hypothetical protein